MFQSSPAPKGGRYICSRTIKSLSYEFQSSPAPKGGRYITIDQMIMINK